MDHFAGSMQAALEAGAALLLRAASPVLGRTEECRLSDG